ncbi:MULTISPECIES: lipid A-modifier LpxR family protein [unclassified Shewanella]|uniref:lipid A-modifier LpxR family protein n=1 Tax=unclassified Shewanella TaxID=196818 RepID=UPI0022BA3BB1|nr:MULTISPECIES: lipid A-modifier LpxR family protein [unclassified Shewanella]
MKYKLILGYLCTLGSLLFSTSAYSGQWHLQLDNDIIFGDDGNYTNGMMLSWESAAKTHPSELARPLQWQEYFTFDLGDGERAWG